MPILDYHTHRRAEVEAQITRLEREKQRLQEVLETFDANTAPPGADPDAADPAPRTGAVCPLCRSSMPEKAKVCPHCQQALPYAVEELARLEQHLENLVRAS